MKKLYFHMLLIFLMACSEKESTTFSIEGSIALPDVDYILLLQESDIEKQISTIIDTIYLDKSGNFSAQYAEEPHLYTLQVSQGQRVSLAVNKGQHITVNISPEAKKISGSEDTELLERYENFRKQSLDSLVNSVRKELKIIKQEENPNEQLIDSLGQLEVQNYNIHLQELKSFLNDHLKNSIALYATSIRWQGEKDLLFFDSIVTHFEDQYPDLAITQKLREKITRLQQTSVGGTAKEILMKNTAGEIERLSTINKNYTLIDFWASWCGPCRRESETLRTLYTTYHPLGFEIYNISLDSDREKWLNAIEKDQRIWINVSSLEAFKTPAAYDYAVTSLPANYLINKDGEIIAKNIHDHELETLLESLLN